MPFSKQRPVCYPRLRLVTQPLQTAWAVIRAEPWVLLLPLLFFAMCVTGGVVAVRYAASSYAATERTKALSLLGTVSEAFGSILQSTLYPVLVITQHLQYGPDAAKHANAQAFFLSSAPSLLQLSSAVDDIQLAPYGVALSIYPLVTKRRNMTSIIAQGGHDLMNASSPIANRRAAAITAITSRVMMLEGPKSLLLPTGTPCTGACTVDPLLGILARQAIFVPSNSTVDQWSGNTTWPGVTTMPDGSLQRLGPITGVSNCSGVTIAATGMNACAPNATGDGTRFWGFSTAIVIWTQLLTLSRVTELGDASSQPYKWSVSRSDESSLGVGTFRWVYVSSNAGALTPFEEDSLTTTVNVFSSAWAFTIVKPGGWQPPWEHGIIAGVVLVSALLAVFAFLLLLERNLHLELLYSMLPKRMVKKMNEPGGGFAESFDHVVILFSDIVSYTDLAATLTPVQTMSMLNDLFADFDQLVDKHGIVKVETIGDGYLCVAGAPSPAEPEAQAQAMANMALDMIEASRRHKAPDGSQLRIRVGLHCGPVMAGVVGRKMPRWCLFGDTVNTASRMESSSSAMRCQVSTQVAHLLAAAVKAPGSRLALHPRGRVSIKGKGELDTFWLSDATEVAEGDFMHPSGLIRSDSLLQDASAAELVAAAV